MLTLVHRGLRLRTRPTLPPARRAWAARSPGRTRTSSCCKVPCRSLLQPTSLSLPAACAQAARHAGTSAQINSSEAPRLHARLQQLMRLHPDAWPLAMQSYKAFCQAAEWVQSRAFHLNAHNFVSLQESEGESLHGFLGALLADIQS